MKRSKIASHFERVKTIAFFWAMAVLALQVLAVAPARTRRPRTRHALTTRGDG